MRAKKKGVSSILGTVIVLAITIALGGILYAYVNGMFNNISQVTEVNAQVELVVNPTTGEAVLQYTLSNSGTIAVNITSISVNGKTIPVSIELQPGTTVQNTTVLQGSYVAGQYYTVIISGHTATGKPLSVAENVLATDIG